MTNRVEKNGASEKIASVFEDQSVADAAKVMQDSRVGCLAVTDKAGSMKGIVTERDICRAASELLDMEKTAVSSIMTKDVIFCSPETESRKIREIMAANHIRHLPAVENGKAVKMHSLRDVVQQQLIETRTAAEQVAMLSACLKSTSLAEIINMAAFKVPKLFDAKRCVLYFQHNLSGNDETIICPNDCLCPAEKLAEVLAEEIQDGHSEGCRIYSDKMPGICRNCNAANPRILIQLRPAFPDLTTKKLTNGKGVLCMCSLSREAQLAARSSSSDRRRTRHDEAAGQSLFYYKANLVKDILNLHISNVVQYQDAKKASMTDALTQVGSRKFFEIMLDNESSRLNRYDSSFSVAIIDVDHFKEINDKFGHVTGDLVLKRVAECLSNQKRNCDFLARYGGDEFVFILPETTAEEAGKMFERIRQKIREIVFDDERSVTISCGIAQTESIQPVVPTELVSKADIALYKAKQAGRDCFRIFNEEQKPQILNSKS